MAMSENSVKVLNYLKANKGAKLTSADVAAALDLPKATINGVFTSFQKKGYGVREEAQVPGTAEVSFLSITDEGRACDVAEMGETVKAIMGYLNSVAGQNVTLDDMTDALGMEKRSVNGSFNALVRKGLCARTTATVEAPVTVKYLVLTADGLAVDPTENND